MKAVFTAFYLCPPAAVPDVRTFISDIFEWPFRGFKRRSIVYKDISYRHEVYFYDDKVELIVTSDEPLDKCLSFINELQEIINRHIEEALICNSAITFQQWEERID